MTTDVSIGDFSRMTHLTVKTLRHYHRVGLLEPAEVDPRTGYRYYSTDQVADAQVIRRFRDLDMPIEEVRGVLTAPDRESRDRLITAHLDRLQHQLEHTQSAVASLRTLLDPPVGARAIEHRSVPSLEALTVSATVGRGELSDWWSSGLAELRATARELGREPAGPAGGLFAGGLFEDEQGDATLYLPLSGLIPEDLPRAGRVRVGLIPAVELAVLVHAGSQDGIDLTYGALGVHVAERGLAAGGPIRERYLVDGATTTDPARWRTEVGWPITESPAAEAR
jgi:DNA-binding transcriptional MerR regulator